MKRFLGIVTGFIAGFIAVMAIESISSLMHPMPEGLDVSDRDQLIEFVSGLPASAFIMVLLAHVAGAFAAGFSCNVITKEKWITGGLILGSVFLFFGIVNLILIPHPTWFAVLDVLIYVPVAVAGSYVSGELFSVVEVPSKPEQPPKDDPPLLA